MNSPRVIISGDFLRPGQDGNIAFLWAALHELVAQVFTTKPELVMARPLVWDHWRHARLKAPHLYADAWEGAELVIGFELPPAARAAAPAWIDIRRHPLRFDAKQVPFSFRTSLKLSPETKPLTLKNPRISGTVGIHGHVAIMLQVEGEPSAPYNLCDLNLWHEFADIFCAHSLAHSTP